MSFYYTPAPWHLRVDQPIKDGHFPHTWIQGSPDNGWSGDRYLCISGICEPADARLLVSAPEMFEALRALVDAHDLSIAGDDTLDDAYAAMQIEGALEGARKAIAKAEGR